MTPLAENLLPRPPGLRVGVAKLHLPVDPALGEWLRSARKAQPGRLTIHRLAVRVGVSLAAVQKLEAQSKPLNETNMRRLAEALELDVDEVLVRSGIVPSDVCAWITAKPARIELVRALMAQEAAS